MDNKERNILLTEEQIAKQIKVVGKIIANDYKDKPIYVLSLLRGSFIFAADLVRAIDGKVQVGFMTTSSYGHGEESTGNVQVVNDIPDNIKGLDVLIVDDIIDTGITMDYVVNHVKNLGANSIKICTLLDKPSRRTKSLTPDYCCFEIEDLFVVGYGLNYGDFYRNVPYIFNWEN
ncbi:hypoxanthine phosphoribosyltransferase [uncultured Clostridium sp.]|uniref:hypoxanthine phosphoribosyltransferase n=1 Tax=uncultured Clostridium sp. TaxID=59620 RepID=UPI00261118EB|nr:hypoxanthine phosphoribosyltransferase [uncultured Clostridium sp.]